MDQSRHWSLGLHLCVPCSPKMCPVPSEKFPCCFTQARGQICALLKLKASLGATEGNTSHCPSIPQASAQGKAGRSHASMQRSG